MVRSSKVSREIMVLIMKADYLLIIKIVFCFIDLFFIIVTYVNIT